MPWNVLLLPLLGGWIVLNFSRAFRPSARRYEGQRLVLTSAAVGAGLLLVARMATLIGGLAVPEFAAAWRRFAPFEYSGATATTILLAAAFVVLGNQVIDPIYAYRRVVESRDDYLEQLLLRSIVEEDSLAFTLKSGKVYVGQVLALPTDLANERKYIRLLPLLSGYREEGTHRLRFSTDYSKVYARLSGDGATHRGTSADEFVLVLPVAEIVSANLFDWDVYEWFNEPATAITAPVARAAPNPLPSSTMGPSSGTR